MVTVARYWSNQARKSVFELVAFKIRRLNEFKVYSGKVPSVLNVR